MLIVLGSVTVTPDSRDVALKASLEHVHRSRLEPGCISHAVHLDAENPDRLVFIEEWADMAALQTHFAVPASREFVAQLAQYATQGPEMGIFDATLLRRMDGRKA